MKNDFESALADFKVAKELDPEQATIIDAEIKKAAKTEKEYDKKMSEKMQNAFKTGI